MKPVLSLIALCFSVAAGCNFPPDVWCSSREIAEKCKVVDQCSVYYMSSSPTSVHFALYYESMCPDCRMFFTDQLSPAFDKIGDIMNLTLVPYGNALEKKVGDKYVFQCQHGKQECIGNLIETCAIYTLKNIKTYFPFIRCMEASGQHPEKAAHQCAGKTSISSTTLGDILKCANGTMGNELEHHMGVITNGLKPPHQYVPWVTLNGVHTEKIQNKAESDLIGLICETYKGPKPSGCPSQPVKKRRCPQFSWLLR